MRAYAGARDRGMTRYKYNDAKFTTDKGGPWSDILWFRGM
jgi:hypothetical protein